MNPIPYQLQPQPPSSHWLPLIVPDPPRSNGFWGTSNIYNQLRELQATVNLAKTMQKELEMLMVLKDKKYSVETVDKTSSENYVSGFLKHLEARKIDLKSQETLSVEAANSLMRKLRAQLEPFRFVADEATPWEEKSAAVRFVTKSQKSKRNKLWRKRKKKRIAETLSKEGERFEQADREADEWRAREVAKESTKKKVDKMNEIAKLKAKEEKKKLESELELVLIVEKLQELRSIRIQKLKKQGHFLPEEDDKFLERVRAAVEEEERQALAAAETDAARDSITTAEESRKAIQNSEALLKDGICDDNVIKEKEEQGIESKDKGVTNDNINNRSERHGHTSVYDYVANLPMEFYHYYHGSNTDIGTLIEVRRTWDAYIRRGGSRIPGHWVVPPPPSDKVWASYLVRPH